MVLVSELFVILWYWSDELLIILNGLNREIWRPVPKLTIIKLIVIEKVNINRYLDQATNATIGLNLYTFLFNQFLVIRFLIPAILIDVLVFIAFIRKSAFWLHQYFLFDLPELSVFVIVSVESLQVMGFLLFGIVP